MARADTSFSVHITRPSLERFSMAELDDVMRGVVFVPVPKPPRVGMRVLIDIAVADSHSLRQQGLVVWSRPTARSGLSAGFRAQLENAHPTVLHWLREVVIPLRDSITSPKGGARPALDAPIQERQRPVTGTWSRVQVPEALPSVTVDLEDHVEVGQDVEIDVTPSRPPTRLSEVPSPRSALRVRQLLRRSEVLALPPPLLMLPGPPVGGQTMRVHREPISTRKG